MRLQSVCSLKVELGSAGVSTAVLENAQARTPWLVTSIPPLEAPLLHADYHEHFRTIISGKQLTSASLAAENPFPVCAVDGGGWESGENCVPGVWSRG